MASGYRTATPSGNERQTVAAPMGEERDGNSDGVPPLLARHAIAATSAADVCQIRTGTVCSPGREFLVLREDRFNELIETASISGCGNKRWSPAD